MQRLSTEQVARHLGIDPATLSRYIKSGKVSAPAETMAGGMRMRLWNQAQIKRLRKFLPKIANGRKTRYQKQKGKTQKPQPRAAVPHKKPKKRRPAQ